MIHHSQSRESSLSFRIPYFAEKEEQKTNLFNNNILLLPQKIINETAHPSTLARRVGASNTLVEWNISS